MRFVQCIQRPCHDNVEQDRHQKSYDAGAHGIVLLLHGSGRVIQHGFNHKKIGENRRKKDDDVTDTRDNGEGSRVKGFVHHKTPQLFHLFSHSKKEDETAFRFIISSYVKCKCFRNEMMVCQFV